MSTEERTLAADCGCRPASDRRAAWLGVLGGLFLSVLVPKCPLCIAGYLALLGLGALAPWAASARPLALGIVVCASLWLLRTRGSTRSAHGSGDA